MKSSTRKFLTAGLLALGIAVPVVLALEATHQPACDRACLLQFAGTYVDGMLAHHTDFPVSADLQATENGQPVRLGQGVWKTARSVSARQYFADPSTGESGVFGVLTAQDGQRSVVALRMKIDRQRIAQLETVVSPEATTP